MGQTLGSLHTQLKENESRCEMQHLSRINIPLQEQTTHNWMVAYIQIEEIDHTDIQTDKRNAEIDLQTRGTHWINTPYSEPNEETNKIQTQRRLTIQHNTTHTRSHLHKPHLQRINFTLATSETPTIPTHQSHLTDN